MIRVHGRSEETIMESILNTTKKLLGIDPEYHDFDVDIIVSINTVLMALNQIGVGKEGFTITGETETWTDFLGTVKNLEAVKTYVYLRVRLIFDTPTSSAVLEAYNNQIREYEWRLYVTAENESYSAQTEGSNV